MSIGGEQESGELQHHRQQIAANRRAGQEAGVARHDQAEQRERDAAAAAQLTKNDEQLDEQRERRRVGDKFAGQQVLAGHARESRVQHKLAGHVARAGVMAAVVDFGIEAPVVQLRRESGVDSGDKIDLKTISRMSDREDRIGTEHHETGSDEQRVNRRKQAALRHRLGRGQAFIREKGDVQRSLRHGASSLVLLPRSAARQAVVEILKAAQHGGAAVLLSDQCAAAAQDSARTQSVMKRWTAAARAAASLGDTSRP